MDRALKLLNPTHLQAITAIMRSTAIRYSAMIGTVSNTVKAATTPVSGPSNHGSMFRLPQIFLLLHKAATPYIIKPIAQKPERRELLFWETPEHSQTKMRNQITGAMNISRIAMSGVASYLGFNRLRRQMLGICDHIMLVSSRFSADSEEKATPTKP